MYGIPSTWQVQGRWGSELRQIEHRHRARRSAARPRPVRQPEPRSCSVHAAVRAPQRADGIGGHRPEDDTVTEIDDDLIRRPHEPPNRSHSA
jgi:hypothetical protein